MKQTFPLAESWLVFVAVCVYTLWIGVHIFGTMAPALTVVSLALGVAAAFFSLKINPIKRHWPMPGAPVMVFMGLILLWVTVHSIFLVYVHDDYVYILNRNNFGDLGLHVGMIRFLSEAQFPAYNPIYSSQPLAYPYGMNLFNSIFESWGIPTFVHLRWTLLMSSLLLVSILYNRGGWLLTAFFLLAGSVGAFAVEGPQLKNFYLSLFSTQRGFLYAMPAGLIVLCDWLESLQQKTSLRPVSVVLLALMPLFHLHTFVALWSLICVATVFHRQTYTRALIISFLAAIPFLWISTHGMQRVSVIHLSPLWVYADFSTFLFEWGLWIFGFLAMTLFLWRVKDPRRFPVLILIGFLILYFNVMLAPWAWDNIKLLVWPLVGLIICVLDILREHLKTRQVLILVLTALMTTHGVVTFVESMPRDSNSTMIFKNSELFRFQSLLQGIDPMARFVIHPTYNHPVSFLGQPVIMGYAGHLWSHAVNFTQTQNHIKAVYTGQLNVSSLREQYGAKYIVWSRREQEAYGLEQPVFKGSLRQYSEQDGVIIYEIVDHSDSVIER